MSLQVLRKSFESPAATPGWRAVLGQIGPQLAAEGRRCDLANEFISANMALLRAHGFLELGVPVELGGAGLSRAELAVMLRELAHHCPSTALALAMHTHVAAAAGLCRHRRGGAQPHRRGARQAAGRGYDRCAGCARHRACRHADRARQHGDIRRDRAARTGDDQYDLHPPRPGLPRRDPDRRSRARRRERCWLFPPVWSRTADSRRAGRALSSIAADAAANARGPHGARSAGRRLERRTASLVSRPSERLAPWVGHECERGPTATRRWLLSPGSHGVYPRAARSARGLAPDTGAIRLVWPARATSRRR